MRVCVCAKGEDDGWCSSVFILQYGSYTMYIFLSMCSYACVVCAPFVYMYREGYATAIKSVKKNLKSLWKCLKCTFVHCAILQDCKITFNICVCSPRNESLLHLHSFVLDLVKVKKGWSSQFLAFCCFVFLRYCFTLFHCVIMFGLVFKKKMFCLMIAPLFCAIFLKFKCIFLKNFISGVTKFAKL